MSFSAKRTGQGIVLIEIRLPAPSQDVIEDDGTALLNNYLTPEQWAKFIQADGTDIEKIKT